MLQTNFSAECTSESVMHDVKEEEDSGWIPKQAVKKGCLIGIRGWQAGRICNPLKLIASRCLGHA